MYIDRDEMDDIDRYAKLLNRIHLDYSTRFHRVVSITYLRPFDGDSQEISSRSRLLSKQAQTLR